MLTHVPSKTNSPTSEATSQCWGNTDVQNTLLCFSPFFLLDSFALTKFLYMRKETSC